MSQSEDTGLNTKPWPILVDHYTLCRDTSVKADFIARRNLSIAVYQYLLYLLFSDFNHAPELLWYYVEHYIVPNSLLANYDQDLWQAGFDKTYNQAFAMHSFMLAAEDLGIVDSVKSQRLFLYWRTKGDIQLIGKELAQACTHADYVLPESRKGLNWLINTMNRYLTSHQQVRLRH